MKAFFSVLFISALLFSCRDEPEKQKEVQKETKVKDSLQVLQGNFIYANGAGVFRGENFVYGVTIDSMAKELYKKVQPYQKEVFEMVPVKVKAKIVPNSPVKNWKENIEIREIIAILPQKDTINNTQEIIK